MVITSLNGNRNFALQCVPRELSILISALDFTLAAIEETSQIPESMVPRDSKNKPDPTVEDFGAAVAEAKLIMEKFAACLPGWREL